MRGDLDEENKVKRLADEAEARSIAYASAKARQQVAPGDVHRGYDELRDVRRLLDRSRDPARFAMLAATKDGSGHHPLVTDEPKQKRPKIEQTAPVESLAKRKKRLAKIRRKR